MNGLWKVLGIPLGVFMLVVVASTDDGNVASAHPCVAPAQPVCQPYPTQVPYYLKWVDNITSYQREFEPVWSEGYVYPNGQYIEDRTSGRAFRRVSTYNVSVAFERYEAVWLPQGAIVYLDLYPDDPKLRGKHYELVDSTPCFLWWVPRLGFTTGGIVNPIWSDLEGGFDYCPQPGPAPMNAQPPPQPAPCVQQCGPCQQSCPPPPCQTNCAPPPSGCDPRYQNCNPPAYDGRQETGKGGQLRFGPGTSVAGFRITYDSGTTYYQCTVVTAQAGWLTDGVINPNQDEISRLPRCHG